MPCRIGFEATACFASSQLTISSASRADFSQAEGKIVELFAISENMPARQTAVTKKK